MPGSPSAIRPLADGVITELKVAEQMLRYFIRKAHRRGPLSQPRLVIAVPSGITR